MNMKKICLQVGHQNIQYNSIGTLHGSTGAPKEMVKNLAITNRTAELLRERGFQVKQTDANANDDASVIDKDWDLFLAIHCDADSSSDGGFTDCPDPATDGAAKESIRIANAIADKFFPESGITRRDERRQKSDGIMYYYIWKYLSPSTPCVLIEMGESVDAHDSVILNDTERCAVALARGVCNAFNVPFEIVIPSPVIDWQKKYSDEVKAHAETTRLFKEYKDGEQTRINEATKPLHTKIEQAKQVLS